MERERRFGLRGEEWLREREVGSLLGEAVDVGREGWMTGARHGKGGWVL